jgi:hypothetical protein
MIIDFTKTSDFDFFVPLDISKSQRQSEKDQQRWIEGIASTDHKDLQGETVYQKGIDFSYFLTYGYFNNDHKPGPGNKIGQPTECKIVKGELWVKGFLFKNHKIADEIWELIHAIKASGSDRKVGFSVQGKVLKRAGSRILACWIQDIAVTVAPVNTNTWLDIVKALDALDPESWCASDFDEIYLEDTIGKAIPCDTRCKNNCKECKCGKKDSSISEEEMDLKKEVEKSSSELSDGIKEEMEHTTDKKIAEKIAKDHLREDPKYYTKLKKMKSEKALAASGSVLVPESLEGKIKNQEFGKSFDFNEVVWILKKAKDLSDSDAHDLAKAAFKMDELLNKGE